MLSQRHNTNAISYWCKEFIRLGASIPREVVVDDGKALVSASCQVFALCPNTNVYIDKCFEALLQELLMRPEKDTVEIFARHRHAHFRDFTKNSLNQPKSEDSARSNDGYSTPVATSPQQTTQTSCVVWQENTGRPIFRATMSLQRFQLISTKY
uniref:Uncharacterized protein n=1 Tax=Cacopsylla melanoneura TaxID=428564 RepID=A0A8D8Z5J3_9HEMI